MVNIFDKKLDAPTKEEAQAYASSFLKTYGGIFVYIPQTGETNMINHLHATAKNNVFMLGLTEFWRRHLERLVSRRPLNEGQVSSVDYLKEVFGEGEFNRVFKFAFVRNPWSRYVANWKYLSHVSAPTGRTWKDRGYSDDAGKVSFESFVKQTEKRLLGHEVYPPSYDLIVEDTAMYAGMKVDEYFLRSQKSHIVNSSGDVAVDFVGKFETLQKDYEYVCKQLSIAPQTIPADTGMADFNDHYSHYYTPELVETVKTLCKADIDYFKYEFDDRAGILPKKKK